MYTPDIENRQHRSMPEHRRIGIVKSPIRLIKSMQRHSDNPCWTAVVVIDVGGRPAGGVGNFKWRRNGQVSDTTVVTRNWSACYLRVVDGMAALCCGRLIGVFQMANDLRWGNYLRSTLFVQQRAPCWPMCVCVTVAVNEVCAGQQCVRCAFVHYIVLWLTRGINASQRLRNIDGKCRTAAPHNITSD